MEISTKSATPVDQRIGRRVRALRIERGLSQTDLGNELGITFQQVQKYEKGVNRISGGRLEQIAKLCNVETAYLFGGNGGASRRNATMIDILMADHFGAQLATAYLSIEDRKVQQSVVAFVKSLAASVVKKKK